MRSAPNRNTKKKIGLISSRCQKTWNLFIVFMSADMQRTAKKCTKNYNARAQSLYVNLIKRFVW